MRFVQLVGLCVGLAVAGTSTLVTTDGQAFDQQGAVTSPVPSSKSTKPSSKASPATGVDNGSQTVGAEFSVPSAGAPAEDGTEVYIPGLGRLGVLPKMDFGLELLYGANDAKANQRRLDVAPTTSNDDLRVRGTVKHNF